MIPQYVPLIPKSSAIEVHDYIASGGWLTEFKKTREFEEDIANTLKASHCICVNNGTIAISLALLALGIKPKDRVIVPDLTMVATATAVQLIGAEPIFIDVEQDTLCLNTDLVTEFLETEYGGKTKAVIYVSLNGRWGNYKKIAEFFKMCNDWGIKTIEDAAQSFASEHEQGIIGSDANITTFSFSPQKIITTGQGGAIVTNHPLLARKLRRLKDFGRLKGGEDIHDYFGINSKFTDLQAVIGLNQLRELKVRVLAKRLNYGAYNNWLEKVSQVMFLKTDLQQTVPWFVDIYVPDRDELKIYLETKGIETRKVYPALHNQRCFGTKRNWTKYPIAQIMSDKGLWLPSSITLTPEQIKYICKCIKTFYSKQN